jgi:hypothetical protein
MAVAVVLTRSALLSSYRLHWSVPAQNLFSTTGCTAMEVMPPISFALRPATKHNFGLMYCREPSPAPTYQHIYNEWNRHIQYRCHPEQLHVSRTSTLVLPVDGLTTQARALMPCGRRSFDTPTKLGIIVSGSL